MNLQEIKQTILRGNMPTKQDLLSIPLSSLRNLDVRTPDQATLIQEVFDEQMSKLPPEIKVNINDIMIKMDRDVQHMTPELEAEYQKQIDKRVDAVKVKAPIDVKIENANEELESLTEEIKHIVTEEEIKDNNLEEVLKPGDEIVIPEVKKPFCTSCASKGIRHLKDCPNNKK